MGGRKLHNKGHTHRFSTKGFYLRSFLFGPVPPVKPGVSAVTRIPALAILACRSSHLYT